MKRGTVVVLGLLLLGPKVRDASAQTTVEGAVVVRSRAVVGHVEVGTPRPVYYRPVREVIVVERVHVPRGRARGWMRRHGYRAVTVYYDGSRYYRRLVRPGLRAVIMFERGGRYYVAHDYRRNERW